MASPVILLQIWWFCCVIIITDSSANNASSTIQTLTQSLFNNYDPTIRPYYDTGGPVENIVQIFILSIDSVNEANMEYKMSMFFRQRWNESRFMFTPVNNISLIELDIRQMDDVWLPDLYIRNEKVANFHHVTVSNKMMYIYPDGTVYYSTRVTGTFSCFMELHSYPLDEQICKFETESYGHSSEFLHVKWHETPVEKMDGLLLAQFEIGDITPYSCNQVYSGILYSCVGFSINLKRNYGYYMIQVFIPTSLVVMLSWVSFWLNIDATPARISLGLLTVLTMTTMSSSARSELPRVSYVKAIDVWVSVCLFFVFAALIEFAHVNVLSRVEQRRRASTSTSDGTKHNSEQRNGTTQPKETNHRLTDAVSREKARAADKVARVVFPLAFLAFNAIYWLVYLLWDKSGKS